MKKQTKTYILLGAVLLIWGMIGFKIYGSLSPAPEVNEVEGIASFQPKAIKEREHFTILADYRDPFLGTMPAKKVVQKKMKKAIVPQDLMPEMTYTGYITDTSTQGKIYFISMAGQQYMLSPKEKVGEMTLISGTATKVKIRYKNRLQTLQLQE